MGYRRLFLIFLSHILTHIVGFPPTQAELLYKYCSKTGNYTNNSKYQTNLNTALSSLSITTTTTTNGFYNISAGKNSSKVNAIALCRGDVEPQICSSCLNDTISMLKKLCPNQKEAIGWSDYCMLRYSNRSIFGTMELLPDAFVWNTNNVSNVGQFNKVVTTLLENLGGRAARGGSEAKFATGSMSGPDNLMVYGLVQCTPDLSEGQCNECLNGTFGLLPKCCDGRIGGRVISPSCNFRYEIGRFYNLTAADAPSAAEAPTPTDATPPPPAVSKPPTEAPPPPVASSPTDAPPQSVTQPPPPPPGNGGMDTTKGVITLSTFTAAAVIAVLVL